MHKYEKEVVNLDQKRIVISQMIIAVISILLGTILHFLFEWTGENKIIASFSAVNESVWEHLKLAFYPMLLMAILEYFFLKNMTNNYMEAKAIGIFVSISFIIVFFYTYSGILGKNYLIIDIASFIASILLGEYVAYQIMIMPNMSNVQTKILSVGIIAYLLISFIVATYIPPKVNLFKDPETQNYGIES